MHIFREVENIQLFHIAVSVYTIVNAHCWPPHREKIQSQIRSHPCWTQDKHSDRRTTYSDTGTWFLNVKYCHCSCDWKPSYILLNAHQEAGQRTICEDVFSGPIILYQRARHSSSRDSTREQIDSFQFLWKTPFFSKKTVDTLSTFVFLLWWIEARANTFDRNVQAVCARPSARLVFIVQLHVKFPLAPCGMQKLLALSWTKDPNWYHANNNYKLKMTARVSTCEMQEHVFLSCGPMLGFDCEMMLLGEPWSQCQVTVAS